MDISYSIYLPGGRKTFQLTINITKRLHALKPHLDRQNRVSLRTRDRDEAEQKALAIFLDFIAREFGSETQPEDHETKIEPVRIPRHQAHPDGTETVHVGRGFGSTLITYDANGKEIGREPAPWGKLVQTTPIERATATMRDFMMEHVLEGPVFREEDFHSKPAAPRKPRRKVGQLTFLELFERYAAFKTNKRSIDEKTLFDFRYAAKAFDDFVQHRTIDTLTRADVEGFFAPNRRVLSYTNAMNLFVLLASSLNETPTKPVRFAVVRALFRWFCVRVTNRRLSILLSRLSRLM